MEHPVEGVEYVWRGSDTVYTFSNINKRAGTATVHWTKDNETKLLGDYPYRRVFLQGDFTPLYNYQENV